MADWGYKADNGPCNWSKNYPIALGTRQSPIDVVTTTAVVETFPPIQAKYGEGGNSGLTLKNTGSSWQVPLPAAGSSLRGGALTGEYQAWQMHAHWGACSGHGSEHTVDGRSFDAELHIVHFNTKYGTPGEAVDKPDGLAVLGVFIKQGAAHPEFAKLMEALGKAQRKGQESHVAGPVDPAAFLPGDRTFFTYEGSLTTPPLLESVIWTVFKEPVEFSEEQIKLMRCLRITCEDEDQEDDGMVDNYRPPCPTGERKVRVAA